MSIPGVEIATVAIKVLGSLIGDKLREKNPAPGQDENDMLVSIESHLEEVATWSGHVQFFGMSSPASLQSATIALDVNAEPRRFRTSEKGVKNKTEKDLLGNTVHNMLLGEPGSGKTTTLKRLAQILLVEPPESGEDTFEFPIVIRLRELVEGESLFVRLAMIFGLKYTQHEVVTRIESTVKGASSKEVRHIENRVGDRRLEDVIPDCLNRSGALLLLDGLDEVRSENEAMLRSDLLQLARRLRSSKIIVTCRSGDYTTQMEGFAILEICPLSDDQIRTIMNHWLGDRADNFLAEVRRVPYYDLADRPLLLTQLLFLYRHYGYLPEQPATIYKKLLQLLLEDWDAERGISRTSKYAGFDPSRKAEFLSALSFHLTYALKEKSFTEDDLVRGYLAIHRPFNLPVHEARFVAREIQTHTGIIITGPRDTYEFCHLSLQEYLCANYLVRSVPAKRLPKHMAAYSAPLAVAVTLSSKPGDWFAGLILGPGNLQEFGTSGLISFLSRLTIERPFFEVSEPLGFALIRLMHTIKEERAYQMIIDIARLDSALESVAKSLRWYIISFDDSDKGGMVRARLRKGFDSTFYHVEAPAVGAIPGWLLPEVINFSEGRIEFEHEPGRTRGLSNSLAEKIAQKCRPGA